MSSIWGKNFKVALFGESHGVGIGITLDGLPAGVELDLEEIRFDLERRATGKNLLTTARKEPDSYEILSGYFNYRTTGTPLSIVIKNRDMRSKDYSKLKDVARPGHADYSGSVRYSGYNDYRGGGHFSGRLTAPIVFAGAVAKQVLAKEGIYIGAHIKSIKDIEDRSFGLEDMKKDLFKDLQKVQLPFLDKEKAEKAKTCILDARDDLDSVGGVIETAVIGMPEGVGSPFFSSVESVLSHILYSVPAVKGVEFGTGFGITKLMGSEANDQMYMDGNRVRSHTNNNGGILGGITCGMPITFKVAIKPTSSISKKQDTVNIKEKKDEKLEVTGRHDPCIVPRALVVVEAVTAIAMLDLYLDSKRYR